MVTEIVILVHGFNVWDGGRATVGKLTPFFEDRGAMVSVVNYGWFGIGRTYVKNKKVAKKLSKRINLLQFKHPRAKIVLVGHSNGCAIINEAANAFSLCAEKAVYINPALNANTKKPSFIKKLDVWYSSSDRAVKWSRWLPFHPWGTMGAVGYIGTDQTVRNFDKQNKWEPNSSSRHSDVFKKKKLKFFGPLIISKSLNR